MTTRSTSPSGAPCWTDLFTSDVASSRAFYSALFGWTAEEPSAEFGGYFMFSRQGVPVCGGMGDMGDVKADNAWKVYLQSSDANATVQKALDAGAQLQVPVMTVADIGTQAVLADPVGASVGVWQPDTFQGFSVIAEHAAPSWFELRTGDFGAAVAFYRDVFGWNVQVVSDTDAFRYAVMLNPDGDGELCGVFDASSQLAAGAPSEWSVYWQVDDIDASIGSLTSLGGTVLAAAQDTPHGRIATVADPAGAPFRLRTPPSA